MKKQLVIIFFLMLSSASIAHEVTIKISLSPAGSFEAKSKKLKGEVKKNGNKFIADNLWVKVEELKTDIDLRDEHLYKHLNYEKFSKISMTQVTADNGKGTGILDVNGVKKATPFVYKTINAKKIEARFNVKPSDFKLKKAKYMEIGVDDKVEIVVLIDV